MFNIKEELEKERKHKYVITPDYYDFNCFDNIVEARDEGLPIACLSNTKDKIVITPKELGHDKFEYLPFEEG